MRIDVTEGSGLLKIKYGYEVTDTSIRFYVNDNLEEEIPLEKIDKAMFFHRTIPGLSVRGRRPPDFWIRIDHSQKGRKIDFYEQDAEKAYLLFEELRSRINEKAFYIRKEVLSIQPLSVVVMFLVIAFFVLALYLKNILLLLVAGIIFVYSVFGKRSFIMIESTYEKTGPPPYAIHIMEKMRKQDAGGGSRNLKYAKKPDE